MSECDCYQEAIDEVLALGGGEESLSVEVRRHLEECPDCTEFLQDCLQLNKLMEEPLPLPPADLTERVMARISADTVVEEPLETRLPWAERFAWAVSGAVGMYCLERIPEYSSSWFEGLDKLVFQSDWVFTMPVAMSATSLALAAFLLFVVQGAIIYGTRSAA